MAGGRGRPFVLAPSRWPVRWRLAVVSASLTFAILLVFAGVVGSLAQDRLTSDFRNDLEATASELAVSIRFDQVTGRTSVPAELDLERMLVANEGTIRLVDARGVVIDQTDERRLPPPRLGTTSFGDLEVATRPLVTTASTLAPGTPVFIQYARDHDELDATIDRLWLFLGIGVAGGTILATLAGLAVAGRAMRPISALTATAREIASTRDPSRSMPKPDADDEVAELARTLDAMLAELDAARGEAQQMVQAQREFVADASHELRTPLTSILANLELLDESLRAEGREDSDDAEMVSSALRSSRRMRRLVGDLLLLARADAGRTGERRRCDLAEIAAAALTEARPVAEDHRLELRAPEAVPVDANPDELHRLALNLLDNGARHTAPGTTIEIAVYPEGESAVLEVTDDGPGLPAGMEAQVFSRFVRGSGPGDVASDGGTGLGLAIVRAVAQSHGGSVEAGTSAMDGARFTVRLPLAGAQDAAPAEARPDPLAS